MRRFLLRLGGVTTGVTALGATFATTSFAAGRPFMPCCINQHTLNAMACCIHQAAMECCKLFS